MRSTVRGTLVSVTGVALGLLLVATVKVACLSDLSVGVGRTCYPACWDSECGVDGCGNSCGECPEDFWCDKERRMCEYGPCNCEGLECGRNICGDDCGACTDNARCYENMCVGGNCWPDCPEMVEVAGGTYSLERRVDHGSWISNPADCLFQADPFMLDTTEVTVAAYRECMDAGACHWTLPEKKWMTDAVYLPKLERCTILRDGSNDRPMNCVTHEQAVEYCASRGKRLPYETEWLAAGIGLDPGANPWGDSTPQEACESIPYCAQRSASGMCVVSGLSAAEDTWCGELLPLPVGTHPVDSGPYGTLDQWGNVREWTATYAGLLKKEQEGGPGAPWVPKAPWYCVREGAEESDKMAVLSGGWTSRYYLPNTWSPNIGFRCAK